MNLVDSSGWLEYFADGRNADFFAGPIMEHKLLLVPTVCIFEVFKRLSMLRGEGDALLAIANMYQGQVVDLDHSVAVSAAQLSIAHQLPMADSIIWATAQFYEATVWTQDIDFKDLPGVKFIPKR